MRKGIVRFLAVVVILFQTQFAVGDKPTDGGDGAVGGERRSQKQSRIKVPKDFDTIQEAIDVAADGDTIMVEKGLYPEVLTIAGKRVNLIGNDRPKIYGPQPRTVGDARTASGLVNYLADGGGILKGFVLEGGDNGIVAFSQRTPASDIEVEDVEIGNTNRGVLVGWGGPVVLKKLFIRNTAWHGIVAKAIKLRVHDAIILDGKGVGILVKDTDETCGTLFTGDNSIMNSTIMNHVGGGVVVFNSLFCMGHSALYGNGKAGLRIIQSEAHVWNNYIGYSYPDLLTGRWGDGIAIVPYNYPSTVYLYNNDIEDSSRASISNFGSYAFIAGNRLQCAGFELDGEDVDASEYGPGLPLNDLSFQFANAGGNVCGCPDADGGCAVVSANLSPPESNAPIE